jgi:peroxiredoxin
MFSSYNGIPMNLIKSLFIAFAPLMIITTAFNGLMLSLNGLTLLGIGMALAALPFLLFLGYLLLFKSLARTGKHLWPVQIPALIGVIISIFSLDVHHYIFTAMAILSYVITMLYIYWYSNNDRLLSKQLTVGEKLPEFKTIDSHGHTVSTADLTKQPTLLMFTRGNWCPLCMAQIDEVVAAYQELDQLGVQVVIIASQPEKNTQNLAARFDVPFIFLVDKDQQLGKQLGILHSNGLPFGFQAFGYQSDQYYPTVIATDETGTIIYSDQTSNYRVRPEPEDLIKLFQ